MFTWPKISTDNRPAIDATCNEYYGKLMNKLEPLLQMFPQLSSVSAEKKNQ
jgi:hypothetical protein